MSETKKPGKGWHGDSEGHARAGAKSSGNKYAYKNLNRSARSKGGSMSTGNFKNNQERAKLAGMKSHSSADKGK